MGVVNEILEMKKGKGNGEGIFTRQSIVISYLDLPASYVLNRAR